jgi:hypothetical protein
MSERTSRVKLPLLVTGQAQKEVTHNEALILLDALVSPVAQSVGATTPPSGPLVGQSWIVGTGASGLWLDHDREIALWTEGGWRFIVPFAGQSAWSIADTMPVQFLGGQWEKGVQNGEIFKVQGTKVVGVRQPAIAGPTGGATVDLEGRIALNAILAALRTHGLIAT